MFRAFRFSLACAAGWLAEFAEGGDGSWRKEFPPWGEPGAAATGSPSVFLPLIGPFTNHACFPSRYMSMRVAVSHVNRRDATFCPAISTLSTSFELRYDMKDTGGSGVGAVSAVLDFISNTTIKSLVKVILGPNSSGASKAASSVLSVFGIPQISWAATNAELSNKANYPQYFRTVSPDSLTMKVLAGLISSLGFEKVNSIYFDAAFQSGQASDFAAAAESVYTMQVTKYSIPNSGESGAAVSERNREAMGNVLEAIRLNVCRVVAVFSVNEEAWDLWSLAYDKGLVNDHGWLWFGADGIAGSQLAGSLDRVYAFVGTIFVYPSSRGPRFEEYAARWAEDMPSTHTPEFTDVDLCKNHSAKGSPATVCSDNPDFSGWVPGLHDESLVCRGYTSLAYDSVVTLAVVADRLLKRTGAHPDELAASDWLEEMKRLSEPNQFFECLSGELAFDEHQERPLPMGFFNWQNGSLSASQVATWTLLGGYSWQVGQQIVWPHGGSAIIDSDARPPAVPSGRTPDCDADEFFSYEAARCVLMCPAGEEPDQTGEIGACAGCPQGKFKPSTGQNSCQSCSAGRVAPQRGMALCSECGPGTFQSAEGQGRCNDCAAGSFAAGAASTSCQSCPAGQHSAEQGASECTRCMVGFYQKLLGQSECVDCPAGITLEWTLVQGRKQWVPFEGATNATSCGCAAGTRSDGNGQCESCGEELVTGVICRGKDDIVIAEGFYAEDESLSVFQCFGKKERCKGGRPGETCADGREGITCDMCEPGMQPAKGGACTPCDGASGNTAFLAFGASAVVCLLLLYIAIDRRGTSHSSHVLVLCALVFSIAVTVLQQIGILGMLDKIEWEDPMAMALGWTKLFTFDVSMLQLDCMFGGEPLMKFVFQVGIVFLCLVLLVAYHCVSVAIFHNCNFGNRMPSLISAVGTVTQIVYISVITTVLGPFQCLQNPNGLWTVRAYQSVICWESDEHHSMLAVGVVATVFPLAYLAKCCLVVWSFPARMKAGDVGLLKSYNFLFFRYKPDCYWYSLVHMLRSLLLGLMPIIPQVSAQVLIMQGVLLAQLICTVSWAPWRMREATHIDVGSTAIIMMVLGCAAFYVEVAPGRTLALLALVLTTTILLGLLLSAVWKVAEFWIQRSHKPFKFFLCHHKAAAGSFARLLKMKLVNRLSSRDKVFLDCDDLHDLETLFDTVGNRVETLVILCTKQVFLRPWCMGEVVTAHKTGIRAIRVLFPDFTELDDAYIDSYSQACPDLSILTSHNISLEDVHSALRWVPSVLYLDMPAELEDSSMGDLAAQLDPGSHAFRDHLMSSPTKVSKLGSSFDIGSDVTTWIVHEEGSHESAATAAILARLLREHFLHSPSDIPQVVSIAEEIPEDATKLIILCTSGALQQRNMLRTFARAIELKAACFPVVGDEGFRFPAREFGPETYSAAAAVSNDPDDLLAELLAVFNTIAGSFLAGSSSETVLDTKAAEIAARLQAMVVDKRARSTVSSVGRRVSSKERRAPTDVSTNAPSDPASTTDIPLHIFIN